MPKHLLLLRFSSLGDVAMTVPVVTLLLQQYPDVEVTFVSTAFVQPLFQNIERLHFYAADTKKRHKGVGGLYRLFQELTAAADYDAIADLHGVLRTSVLKSFFYFTGKPIATIDKGRKEKKELTRNRHKKLRPLKSTFQRYADVFAALELPVALHIESGLLPKQPMPQKVRDYKEQQRLLVGIAPIAQYKEKTYPPQKMKEVVRLLSTRANIQVLLFGGKSEAALLSDWQQTYPQTQNLAGCMPFAEELQWISHLDVMISMDSANMHLASLYGVPVVSVWGGTHPYLGFMGWGQSMNNAVQIDLPCRPSSVFGNKECVNQHACMEGISALAVYEKVMQLLQP